MLGTINPVAAYGVKGEMVYGTSVDFVVEVEKGWLAHARMVCMKPGENVMV